MQEVKQRDLPITGIRLPPELRLALQREAHINGTSLNSEVVVRLQRSLQAGAGTYSGPVASNQATVLNTGEAAPAWSPLDDAERTMLTLYKRLPPDKQLALLTLLRK